MIRGSAWGGGPCSGCAVIPASAQETIAAHTNNILVDRIADRTALLAFELDSLKLKMFGEWVHRSVSPNNVVFIDWSQELGAILELT